MQKVHFTEIDLHQKFCLISSCCKQTVDSLLSLITIDDKSDICCCRVTSAMEIGGDETEQIHDMHLLKPLPEATILY